MEAGFSKEELQRVLDEVEDDFGWGEMPASDAEDFSDDEASPVPFSGPAGSLAESAAGSSSPRASAISPASASPASPPVGALPDATEALGTPSPRKMHFAAVPKMAPVSAPVLASVSTDVTGSPTSPVGSVGVSGEGLDEGFGEGSGEGSGGVSEKGSGEGLLLGVSDAGGVEGGLEFDEEGKEGMVEDEHREGGSGGSVVSEGGQGQASPSGVRVQAGAIPFMSGGSVADFDGWDDDSDFTLDV